MKSVCKRASMHSESGAEKIDAIRHFYLARNEIHKTCLSKMEHIRGVVDIEDTKKYCDDLLFFKLANLNQLARLLLKWKNR